MIPLTSAKAGETVTIKKITGRDELRRHLAEMGFVVDDDVTVVNEMAGNLIVQVKDSRVALNKDMANRILFNRAGEIRRKSMKTLKDMRPGETATVARLLGEGPVKRRIMDMGITRGTEIFVRKVAPLGDPMELSVRGYELSIRKADAEMIEME